MLWLGRYALGHNVGILSHWQELLAINTSHSMFVVMKNLYKQILAYAVTIHKRQGLLLDCAIVDLSEEVFSDIMAYMALFKVR